MSNVPDDVRTSSAGMPATPVQPQSYQSRRLAEMGVPVDQQNLAPVTEDTRRSLLRDDEVQWINTYHAEVRRRLSPLVSGDALAWLQLRTEPL